MDRKKTTLFAIRHRLSITLVIFALSIFFSIGLQWLRVEPNLASVLPQSKGQKTDSIYATDDGANPVKSIFVIFDTKEGVEFFSTDVMNALSRFHNELLFEKNIPRASILDLINTFNDFEDIPFTQETLQNFKKQVLDAPFISEMFLSNDLQASIVTIVYRNSDFYEKSELYGSDLPNLLEGMVERYSIEYPFLNLGISGTAMVEDKIISYMSKDLSFLFPTTIGIIFILLLLLIRSFTAAIFPLFVAFISVVWTLGLKGWIGSDFTLVEAVLPIMLISIGCADGVHIMNDVVEHLRRKDSLKDSITFSMRRLRLPIILTSVTTGLGFGSLITASSTAFKSLGIFMTFGILVAMAFSLWGVPAILSYLPLKPAKGEPKPLYNSFMGNVFVKLTTFLLGYKKMISFVLVVLFGLSLYSFWTINIDFDEVGFLKKSTEVRQMADNLQKRFGGYGIITLTLNKKDGSSFRNLKDLQEIEKIESHLKGLPNTSFITSVNFIIKGMNYKLRGQVPEEYRIIDNPVVLRQVLNLIDNTPALASSLPGFIKDDWHTLFISIRVEQLNTNELKRTAAVLEPLLREIMPDTINYSIGGDYRRLILSEVILKEQIVSMVASLITIFLVMFLLLRSFSNALIIVFPVFWATFFNFLFMKVWGIPLNPGTATVASIGMGVGVDYTIHYFSAFRRIYQENQDYLYSILQAIRETFQGIFFNAIAVGIGFMTLLFSSYEIVMLMSVIVIFTMITSAIASLTILPIFLDMFRPKISLYNMDPTDKSESAEEKPVS